jgi:hypothetical protein
MTEISIPMNMDQREIKSVERMGSGNHTMMAFLNT